MAIGRILTILALGAVAVFADDDELIAVVKMTPHNADKYNVTGEIKLYQSSAGGPTTVNGTLYGLSEGLHGFHIHQTGDTSNGCLSLLGHFNPDKQNHGGPEDTVRHAGDLGNIVAGSDGVAAVAMSDSIITLIGSKSVLGRSIVVHALEDDLGRGQHELSLSTGNAGDRAACGIIGILSPVDSWVSNSGRSGFWSSSNLLISAGIVAVFIQNKY